MPANFRGHPRPCVTRRSRCQHRYTSTRDLVRSWNLPIVLQQPTYERTVMSAYGQKIHLRCPAPSRRFAMVITQEPAQSLAALHRPLTTNVRIPREQQDVALPLVISLSVEMLDIFAQRPSQRTLTEEHHLGQALLLHRPDPALRIGIQVRAARWQHERFDLP
jgi:hypothetical protein